ncbi:SDR family NAD(P)-dependent oxidoreductase [Maritimibacter sp. DP1N21-5]|uniref:SDR family NAD(P)-dependent oxidoreductase n=1 Tax=Maritimibacter sp. DP1N21-5 TaxID=2836867 RepID=UPI001C45B21E|nr:SDR family NAD(P)-dependent oxidoreductase [Maritimibacter sp. DP1N21-5]MBV7408482.1 SDR family NAD(P)-dependent oxidoreductase [Maritimibacter sp. DP1N21-5]
MADKSLLITGCSTGIGYDAAHGMRARGWRVFATCRSEADCERLRAEGLESFRLDHTDATSIADAIAEATRRTGGTLDAVFVNAGVGIPVAAEDLSLGALREVFEVNLFGAHEVIRNVIPVMRAQGHGRIVNCSSTLGLSTIRWRAPYAASKFALEGYTDTLRLELGPANIQAILIEPGPITSHFRLNSKKMFEKWVDWETSALRDQYAAQVLPRLTRDIDARDPFELPASAVTEKLARALESTRPRPRYFVTTPTHVAYWGRRLLPTRLADWLLAKA